MSILAKRDQEDAAPLVETVSTLVTGGLLLITVLLVVFAGFFIDLVAPGLEGTVRELAILQLQIMAPLAVFAGLIGIGFGVLNASDQYWLPGISPLFSSLSVVLGVGSLIWILGEQASAPNICSWAVLSSLERPSLVRFGSGSPRCLLSGNRA